MEILISTIREWPAWIMVTIGFYIAYRVFKFPDLTVDASFIAGTVGTACAAVYWNSTLMGLLLAVFLGALAGFFTSVVYLTNPRPAYKLLAGVLVIFAFYSINYRVLGHQVEAGFAFKSTAMNALADFEANHGLNNLRPLTFLVGLTVVGILIISLRWLFQTNYGIIIRSIGSRQHLVSNNRFKAGIFLSTGLILTNIIVGIGGWFYASINTYASINVFGTIIHALAAAIIGEAIFERLPFGKDRRTSVWALLTAPVVGATIYQLFKSIVAWIMTKESESIDKTIISINQQDHNTFIAVILVIVIVVVRWFALHRNYTYVADEEESGG